MNKTVFTLEEIKEFIRPMAEKYKVKEVYLFGSYARGEADSESDLDFLVYGGEGFKLTRILGFAQELREMLQKDVDAYEIREIRKDSELYASIMRDKVRVV